MPTSSTCNSISRAVTDRSPRSTSCSKTRTTSSEPAPRAAQWAGQVRECAGANESFGAMGQAQMSRSERVNTAFSGSGRLHRRKHEQRWMDELLFAGADWLHSLDGKE